MNNEQFIKILALLDMDKTDFAKEVKIPKNTVYGWTKKGNSIPEFVEYLLKIMLENKRYKVLYTNQSFTEKLLKKKTNQIITKLTSNTEPAYITRAKKIGFKTDNKDIIIERGTSTVGKVIKVANLKHIKIRMKRCSL